MHGMSPAVPALLAVAVIAEAASPGDALRLYLRAQ